MDPSNSFESQAFVNANQLEQTETISCMDHNSYYAAAEGKIVVFKDITDQSLDLLRTPNKNTILHIYITALNSGPKSNLSAGSETTTTLNTGAESTTRNTGSESTATLNSGSESTANFVEKILEMCPSLLWQANAKGETPLHIAARYGHDGIVEVLIKYCAQILHDQDLEEGIEPVKELLRMTNKEKDTALHEAVRYNHLQVVELLINKDPDFSYSANDAGETPLYIAAERGFKDVLFKILDKCKYPILHGGPLGRTALHAAILRGTGYEGMVGRILENIEGISREADNNGWTPLHLAACLRLKDIVELLLDKDKLVAYMKDTKGRTPLHIAAQRGFPDAVKMIVERCPDCCELVDKRGWNVLHFAINDESDKWHNSFHENVMDIIIENWSFSNLLNEKNADGDTPLHLYSNSSCYLHSAKNFIRHPRVDKMAFNKQHLNAKELVIALIEKSKKRSEFVEALNPFVPQRVITYQDDTTKLEDKNKEKKRKRKEKERSMLQKATEVHLVVAALIATVTFAACITMPGGFVGGGEGSHPGSVLLRRKAAFKTFVITDTISMVLSSSAVFIYLLLPFLSNSNYDDESHPMNLVYLAYKFILWAMIAMVLAFVTGTYAVLMPSLYLAITNCIIGLTFFAILLCVFQKFPDFSFSIFMDLCPWIL